MAEWDLNTYYWPKARVERWWKQGWDWDSLLTKPCPHPDFDTYADYYGEAFSRTVLFDDPRPDKTGQISEWEYWHDPQKGDRWLTEFAGKKWTPYHLPLYDLDGNLSTKHPICIEEIKWSIADSVAFVSGLKKRMRLGDKDETEYGFRKHRAPLNGIVVQPYSKLSILEKPIFVDFCYALFASDIDFSNTKFSNYTLFRNVCFGESTDFSGSTFDNVVSFYDTYFGDIATFNRAKFGHLSIFSRAKFGCATSFEKATFSITYFTNTSFKENCSFVRTAFNGSVNFSSDEDAPALKNISFAGVTFNYDVDFTGRSFFGTIDFHQVFFKGLTKFYGAKLSEETYFPTKDTNWPLPPKPKSKIAKTLTRLVHSISGNHKSSTDVIKMEVSSVGFEEYEKAFCCLKKIQQGHEARTAEHFFYKQELKARMRRSDIRWTEKFAAGAYGKFSDYGESIGRPLAWLFVSFLIATAVTCCAALPFWHDFAPDNLGFAATAAWHNLVPGGFVKDVFQGCHDEACRSYRYGEWSDHLLTAYGFGLYFVTGLFAAGNLALWFLFGLALKRRFQIK